MQERAQDAIRARSTMRGPGLKNAFRAHEFVRARFHYPEGHDHPTEAGYRTANEATATAFINAHGCVVFDVQMSERSRRDGLRKKIPVLGIRRAHTSADLGYQDFEDEVPDDGSCMLLFNDVDWFVWCPLMYSGTKEPIPVIIVTKEVLAAGDRFHNTHLYADVDEDGDTTLEMHVGASRYGPHKMWNYNVDTVEGWYDDKVVVFNVERRRRGEPGPATLWSLLVGIFPSAVVEGHWMVTGLLWLLAYGRLPQGFKRVRNTTRVTPNIVRTEVHRCSKGAEVSYRWRYPMDPSCVRLPASSDAAIAEYGNMNIKKGLREVTAFYVNSKIESLGVVPPTNASSILLAAAHSGGVMHPEGVDFLIVGDSGIVPDDVRRAARLEGAVEPAVCCASMEQNRLAGLRGLLNVCVERASANFNPDIESTEPIFTDMLVAATRGVVEVLQSRAGGEEMRPERERYCVPWSIEEVMARHERGPQIARDLAQVLHNPDKLKTLRAETVGKAEELTAAKARIISSFPVQHTNSTSRFAGPLEERAKETLWCWYGGSPLSMTQKISYAFANFEEPEGVDDVGMDNHWTAEVRELTVNCVIRSMFDPDSADYEELLRLLDLEMSTRVDLSEVHPPSFSPNEREFFRWAIGALISGSRWTYFTNTIGGHIRYLAVLQSMVYRKLLGLPMEVPRFLAKLIEQVRDAFELHDVNGRRWLTVAGDAPAGTQEEPVLRHDFRRNTRPRAVINSCAWFELVVRPCCRFRQHLLGGDDGIANGLVLKWMHHLAPLIGMETKIEVFPRGILQMFSRNFLVAPGELRDGDEVHEVDVISFASMHRGMGKCLTARAGGAGLASKWAGYLVAEGNNPFWRTWLTNMQRVHRVGPVAVLDKEDAYKVSAGAWPGPRTSGAEAELYAAMAADLGVLPFALRDAEEVWRNARTPAQFHSERLTSQVRGAKIPAVFLG